MMPSTIDVQRVAAALEVMIGKVDRAEPFALAVESASVGRRQLERSFANLMTTPDRELRRIRLQLASGELISKQASSIQLKAISTRVGYRHERRLREATREAYELSPSEVRRGARLERNLKLDEKMRAEWRGTGVKIAVWNTALRRRRHREALQRLLRKANVQGEKVILGHISFPRPSEARRIAPELAMTRARELYKDSRGELRRVA
jgi:AraC-like DNA-binding protein